MRKSWDSYFLDIAKVVSERATCERLKVGAVIVKDKRIISTGYNGGICGEDHCIDVGCKIEKGHCIRTIHAEHNAILQCAKHGISTDGATIYVTHLPCYDCMQAIIQSGIKKVVYAEDYRMYDKTIDLVLLSDIEVYQGDIDKRKEWAKYKFITRMKKHE